MNPSYLSSLIHVDREGQEGEKGTEGLKISPSVPFLPVKNSM